MAGALTEKYGMEIPNGFFKLERQTNEVEESKPGVLDAVKETAEKLNPLNLVDKAGNFALRAVVILVATGLIALGFYFMLSNTAKSAVLKAVAG